MSPNRQIILIKWLRVLIRKAKSTTLFFRMDNDDDMIYDSRIRGIMNFLWNICAGCTGVEKSVCARVFSPYSCAPLRQEGPLLAPEISLKVSMDSTLEGGQEMVASLEMIFNLMDKVMMTPEEWSRMMIRAIDKKGPKLQMKNKRGLFLTNIISKVYEKVVKNRNEEESRKNRSPWQMGGVKKRSPTDNTFILYSIVERNTYLNKPTYVYFADAEKCFDKLWLEDSVIELWMQGTNIRDAIMIKKMNEEARITIKTPVGNTEEIVARNIVRQGTVYGPQMCGVSMARVNDIGRNVITFYGPNLILQATQYVDDITSAGSPRAINNTIYNCSLLEDQKKMSFSIENGKTEYVIINPKKENEAITQTVRKGHVPRAKEHKALGTWVDEKGTYGINVKKNKMRLSYMVETVRAYGSPKNVGIMALVTRIKLADSVTIPSLLYNIECVPKLNKEEIKNLESMQREILARVLDVPNLAPRLLETELPAFMGVVQGREGGKRRWRGGSCHTSKH